MIGIYVGAAMFGGIVLGVSLVTGGHEGDHDHDHAGHDHDHDSIGKTLDLAKDTGHDVQWLWMPFLSLRFWIFFLASFGLTGTLLSLVGFQEPLVGLISTPFGAAIGWGAAQVFRQIRTDQVTATTNLSTYAGLEAKVMVPVRPGDLGKISVSTLAGRVEMPAKSRDGTVLEAGATVLIASVVDGTADVTGIGGPPAPREGVSE
jgi:hypothetical protein